MEGYRGPDPAQVEQPLDDITLARLIVTLEVARKELTEVRETAERGLVDLQEDLAIIKTVFLTKDEFQWVQASVYALILTMVLVIVGMAVWMVVRL